jgi:ferredoxin--NADP+ reductase
MAHLADFNIENKYKATIKKSERLTPQETEDVREILL